MFSAVATSVSRPTKSLSDRNTDELRGESNITCHITSRKSHYPSLSLRQFWSIVATLENLNIDWKFFRLVASPLVQCSNTFRKYHKKTVTITMYPTPKKNFPVRLYHCRSPQGVREAILVGLYDDASMLEMSRASATQSLMINKKIILHITYTVNGILLKSIMTTSPIGLNISLFHIAYNIQPNVLTLSIIMKFLIGTMLSIFFLLS